MQLPKEHKKHTYGDYLSWTKDERWEIIDGVPYLQAAPTWQHQAISVELISQFNAYLRGKACRVFAAPFDLCLVEQNQNDDDVSTVVQPDIVIVCDESRLRKTGYFGVPPLIIEISSPSTAKNDKIWKLNKYEKVGVKEYWIIEPEGKIATIFTLQENNRYGRPEYFTETDQIKTSIFEDFSIDLSLVFTTL